jgi:N-acetylglucosamine kinase-like BadF-type ATPase
MKYYLGIDIGATKTAALISDEHGRVIGTGRGGPGNHETVGFDGMHKALSDSVTEALADARLSIDQISGAGFGIAGYDWTSEEDDMRATISRLGLKAPCKMVNDVLLGLLAGASEGWGVAVVSGTGCNCRGRDKGHKREGRVTGYGTTMGEGAGGSELIARTMQIIGYSWTKRLPPTALADAFIKHAGAKDLEDLIHGHTAHYYDIGAHAAPLVFQVAEAGDQVARDLITWAGHELAEMANAVIRQLDFEKMEFEVVLIGSMFKGGELLITPMREKIHELAPKARLIRTEVKPVIGAALLGMEAAGVTLSQAERDQIKATLAK